MKNFNDDEVLNLIFSHSCRLTNIKNGMSMLNRFIEDDGYIESKFELCSLSSIINEYCINTSQNFKNIEEILKFD